MALAKLLIEHEVTTKQAQMSRMGPSNGSRGAPPNGYSGAPPNGYGAFQNGHVGASPNGHGVTGAMGDASSQETVTIRVRVPSEKVGLVVGKKGQTIQEIQHFTHTSATTPSRGAEPYFVITGAPGDVDAARQMIEFIIRCRTGQELGAWNAADVYNQVRQRSIGVAGAGAGVGANGGTIAGVGANGATIAGVGANGGTIAGVGEKIATIVGVGGIAAPLGAHENNGVGCMTIGLRQSREVGTGDASVFYLPNGSPLLRVPGTNSDPSPRLSATDSDNDQISRLFPTI